MARANSTPAPETQTATKAEDPAILQEFEKLASTLGVPLLDPEDVEAQEEALREKLATLTAQRTAIDTSIAAAQAQLKALSGVPARIGTLVKTAAKFGKPIPAKYAHLIATTTGGTNGKRFCFEGFGSTDKRLADCTFSRGLVIVTAGCGGTGLGGRLHTNEFMALLETIGKALPEKVERREKLTLNEQQLESLVREAEKTCLIAPVVLAGTCGLRRGEICGLRWQCLDLDEAGLMITQTLQRQTGEGLVTQGPKSERSRRRVPLLPSAVPYLRKWLARQREERLVAGPAWQGGDYVCTTLDGGPLDPGELNRRFRRLVDSIGLPPVAPHGLRHTLATLAIKNGADVKWVQAVLGHKSAAFTLDT
jgi:integrase